MTKIFQVTICFCFLITKAGSVITDDGLALVNALIIVRQNTPKDDMIKIIKRRNPDCLNCRNTVRCGTAKLKGRSVIFSRRAQLIVTTRRVR